MLRNSSFSLTNRSILLLVILILASFLGNYLSLSFGFGVDFLFGSIFILVIVNLYGSFWAILANIIAGFYTIYLWQHPYALLLFTGEIIFIAWRLKRASQNLVIVDLLYWLFIGMPLVWIFYHYILQVGTVTTLTILFKQPVNGLFNALVASLILTCKPIHQWADNNSKNKKLSFEEIVIDLLVAFVFIPVLILMTINNQSAMSHEENFTEKTLQAAAANLAFDLNQWNRSSLEGLQKLADVIAINEGQSAQDVKSNLEITASIFPGIKQIYFLSSEQEIIVTVPKLYKFNKNNLDISQLNLPRKATLVIMFADNPDNPDLEKPIIIQTMPIIRHNTWVGNIVAQLDIDFIHQLLRTNSYSLTLSSTLLNDKNQVIASTNPDLNPHQIFDRHGSGAIRYLQSDYLQSSVYHWIPFSKKESLIGRWKKSFYGQEIPVSNEIPLNLIVEAPAKPHIEYLQSLYIRSLSILLLIAICAILVAQVISSLLVKPILTLASLTTNIPDKLVRHSSIHLPSSPVLEIEALVKNFQVMTTTIEQNFLKIQYANKQLQQAKESAVIANQAKTNFLANISHELRTPLSNVLGYTNLLKRHINNNITNNKNISEYESINWLTIIENSGDYLLNLINDILDLSKMEVNKIELQYHPLNFLKFIEEIVEISSFKAREKKIIFQYEALDKLPNIVNADEKRLRQVLFNLLGNAIKFTERGKVLLRIKVIDRENLANKAIVFEVIDTGVGIDPDDLSKVFQPFEQAGSLESKQAGTGLGLAICKELVALMGGNLKVESRLNQGSRFWFEINVTTGKNSPEPESDVANEIIGYHGEKRKILVIDDQLESRLLCAKILESFNFEVITAENGEQGLSVARQDKPSLILIDLFMPIRTGFTIVPELRKISDFEQLPIVGISASNLDLLKKQSMAAGCNAFLAKPFNERKLLDLLKEYLRLEWIYQSTVNSFSRDN